MSNKRKIFFSVAILAVISALLFLNPVFGAGKNLVYKIVSPFSGASNALLSRLRDFGGLVVFPGRFVKEKNEITDKYEKLLGIEAELQESEKENKFLREALSLKERRKLSFGSGRVVGRNLSGGEIFFIIDQGRDQDIQKGEPVLSSAGHLLGVIEKVFSDTSRVRLIVDPNFKITARVGDFLGTLKGESGLNLKFDLVPVDEAIQEGEKVITAGAEKIPPGFLIGVVEEVQLKKSQPLQEIFVSSVARLHRVTNLLVVQNK